IDAFGQLSNGAGQLVLGNGGPIALPPFGAVEVGADGTVSVLPLGQNPNSMAIIDRIKLVTLEESDIVRGEDGLMRLASGNIAASDASVQLLAGNLETSNVNTVSEMVKMIELARRFEAQVQLMQSAEENSQALSRIMRMS
ncbi:MAG: flagellar biosynthesis protein FlgF, partial [Halieaceae bacterium]|nr:flagellar biosynthesis protein FlgF [Halieaceae bacterium]